MPPIKQANRVDRGPDPGSLRHTPAIRPCVDFSTWCPFRHRIAKRSRFSAFGQLRSVELYGPGDFDPGQRKRGIGADPGCIPHLTFHYSHPHWAIQGTFGATGAVAPDKVLLAMLQVEEMT